MIHRTHGVEPDTTHRRGVLVQNKRRAAATAAASAAAAALRRRQRLAAAPADNAGSAVTFKRTNWADIGLAGRCCVVLWDLDNLTPPRRRAAAAVKGLRALLAGDGNGDGAGDSSSSRKAPPRLEAFKLFANGATLRALGPAAAAALEAAGAVFVPAPAGRDTADVLLASAACEFAAMHLPTSSSSGAGGSCPGAEDSPTEPAAEPAAAAVIIVSDDVRFAPLLRYLSARGAATVSIARPPPPRPHAPAGTAVDWRRHALAREAGAVAAWPAGGGSSSGSGRRRGTGGSGSTSASSSVESGDDDDGEGNVGFWDDVVYVRC